MVMEQNDIVRFHLETRVYTVLTEGALTPGPENLHVGKAWSCDLQYSALMPGPEPIPVRLQVECSHVAWRRPLQRS